MHKQCAKRMHVLSTVHVLLLTLNTLHNSIGASTHDRMHVLNTVVRRAKRQRAPDAANAHAHVPSRPLRMQHAKLCRTFRPSTSA